MYVVDATCFDECFLFRVVLEDIIFDKSSSLPLNRHIVAFFEASVLKEVRILLIYLHRAVLITVKC